MLIKPTNVHDVNSLFLMVHVHHCIHNGQTKNVKLVHMSQNDTPEPPPFSYNVF